MKGLASVVCFVLLAVPAGGQNPEPGATLSFARPQGPMRVGMVERRQHWRDSRPLELRRDGKERGRTQVLVSGDEEDLRVSSLQFPGGRG